MNPGMKRISDATPAGKKRKLARGMLLLSYICVAFRQAQETGGDEMTAEEKILAAINWKEQAVEDCMKWARMKAPDSDLNVYKAGLQTGWDKCLSILKLHNLLDI
jgi:hypothetical protein